MSDHEELPLSDDDSIECRECGHAWAQPMREYRPQPGFATISYEVAPGSRRLLSEGQR